MKDASGMTLTVLKRAKRKNRVIRKLSKPKAIKHPVWIKVQLLNKLTIAKLEKCQVPGYGNFI
jgi:hypothetical protein